MGDPREAASAAPTRQFPKAHLLVASFRHRGLAALAVALLVGVTALAAVGPAGAAPAADEAWPDPDEAQIRPGVRVAIEGSGRCTTNFVFQDQDTGQLYIGTAAHCANGEGDTVRLDGFSGPVIGSIAYWSRAYEDVHSVSCYVLFSCSAGDGNRANDFALIEIAPAWEDSVHPAVLHFGGPTGMAAPGDVSPLDKVLTYGNSRYRWDVEPLSWKEGYVVDKSADGWTFNVYTATPGIPGDSGSNALLGDGRALGIVNTMALVPPGMNGVTSLHTALAFARDVTGQDLVLQTAPLEEDGLAP